MIYAVVCFLLLALLYLLALRGRRNHRLLMKLRQWNYAHRGLHGNGIPENSMASFRLALERGYGIELDVHLLKDGNLAVIHDASLLRTVGVDIRIEELTTQQLQDYHLEGTGETIPTFRQVLELFDGKAPMVVELKPENGNHNELSQKACDMLAQYKGLYCIESFDPRCIRWLKKNRPHIVRGQLAYDAVHDKNNKVPLPLRFIMSNLLSNFWNTPDFVAYAFEHRKKLSVKLARKLWKIQGVCWTIRKKEDFETAVQEDWIPIFEKFEP